MAFRIIRSDITRVAADVIVNSANPRPICGGSTEAAIYDAAGYDELLEARQEIGPLEIGQLGVTPAFNLPAKNIVHISCPWWDDENPEESKEVLVTCYAAAVEKALQLGAKSVAFPLLSSGVYRFPKAVALEVATDVFRLYGQVDIEIILVVYDDEAFAIAAEMCPRVDDLLNPSESESLACAMEDEAPAECASLADFQVEIPREEKYRCSLLESRQSFAPDESPELGRTGLPKFLEGYATVKTKPKAPAPQKLQLEDEIASAILAMDDDTFQDKMMGYITEKGMDPATVYRAANLDRKLFSKVKKDGYVPSKNTVLALAVGLQLNLEETTDLLSRANHAFSPSSKRDVIIRHFIERGNLYKKGASRPIDVINDYLTCFREEPLGDS